MSKKLFIALLILLAVLFVVGVGLGATQNSNGPLDPNPGWVTAIQDLLVRPQALEAKDISFTAPATCLQAGEVNIPAGATCVFVIKNSSASLRRLDPKLPPGCQLEAALQQPNAVTAHQSLPSPKASEHLDIFKDGATLTLQAKIGGAACLFSLKG